MTIHLPNDLESSVRAEVLSGHFANEDAMVAAAVREYLRQHRQEQPTSAIPDARDSGLGSIGAMKNAADELDEIVEDAMRRRREEPWRVIPGE